MLTSAFVIKYAEIGIKGKNRYVECFKLIVETAESKFLFDVRNDALTDEAVAKISRMAESKRQES